LGFGGIGVHAEGEDLPDGEPVGLGCLHQDLVGPLRIRHPALRDGDPVLVEVEAVDAADGVQIVGVTGGGGDVRPRSAVGPEVQHHVEQGRALDVGHVGQMGDRLDEGRAVADVGADGRVVGAREHSQFRRVGAGQVRNKGRLRAPAGCHRPHGHATQQSDQDGHRQVAGPAAPEGGTEPVPGDTEQLTHFANGLSGRTGWSRGSSLEVWSPKPKPSRWAATRAHLVLAPFGVGLADAKDKPRVDPETARTFNPRAKNPRWLVRRPPRATLGGRRSAHTTCPRRASFADRYTDSWLTSIDQPWCRAISLNLCWLGVSPGKGALKRGFPAPHSVHPWAPAGR
jgi:hypothetical protein